MNAPTGSGLVVVAHPDPESFNRAIADQVARSWSETGIEVKLHDLYAECFDPILTREEHRGETSRDPLVRRHIADLRASDLLAIVHPNCWGAPPAMMKGWIDRVFAPNSAYAFEKGSDGGEAPIGLLTIKAALVLNTGNTPADRERDAFGDPLDRIWRQCVLPYCGVANVKRELFGVVALSTAEQRAAWLAQADALARSAAEALVDLATSV